MPAPKEAIGIVEIQTNRTLYVGYDRTEIGRHDPARVAVATAEGLRTAEAAAGALAARKRHGVNGVEWRIKPPQDIWNWADAC